MKVTFMKNHDGVLTIGPDDSSEHHLITIDEALFLMKLGIRPFNDWQCQEIIPEGSKPDYLAALKAEAER